MITRFAILLLLLGLASDLPAQQASSARSANWRAVFKHDPQLIEEASLSFPIILSASGAVMDGMHRSAKTLLQGLEEIDAVQFDRNPEPDHIGLGPEELTYCARRPMT